MSFEIIIVSVVVIVTIIAILMMLAVIFLSIILAESKINKQIWKLNREINDLINSL